MSFLRPILATNLIVKYSRYAGFCQPRTNFCYNIAMHYVYVLKNEFSELYYGCTNNLKKRFFEHNSGKSFSTKNHQWKLVYYEAYFSEENAIAREKRLKNYGQALAQLKRRIKKSLSRS